MRVESEGYYIQLRRAECEAAERMWERAFNPPKPKPKREKFVARHPKEAYRQMIEEGYSSVEIAARFNVSDSTVRNAASRMGLKFVKKKIRTLDKYREPILKGWTGARIAAHLGVKKPAVYNAAKKLGLTVARKGKTCG